MSKMNMKTLCCAILICAVSACCAPSNNLTEDEMNLPVEEVWDRQANGDLQYQQIEEESMTDASDSE